VFLVFQTLVCGFGIDRIHGRLCLILLEGMFPAGYGVRGLPT
jgi:hypothetical protein